MVDFMAVLRRLSFLSAFRYRSFTFLWGSASILATAISMEMVVLGWLVLEMTDSPQLVGLIAAFRFAGTALAPYFGALADRFDRRRILLIARALGFFYTLAFTALYYSSNMEIWHIFVLGLLGSVIRTVDMPTNNALTPDTVGSGDLASAIGMMMVGMSTMRMLGPLIGGQLYESIGAGVAFMVMAGIYLLSFLTLLPVRSGRKEFADSHESVWSSIAEGLRYITRDRALFALIVLAAIANMFTFPSVIAVMPVFARDVLLTGSSGFGQLIAAEGFGGLLGTLLVSALGKFRHQGLLLIGAMIGWPLFLIVFANMRVLPAALVLMVFVGIARGIAMVVIQLLLLMWSEEKMRGRVMGARMLAIFPLLLGNILTGIGAERWGAATIIVINALGGIITTIMAAIWAPHLRHRK